MSILTNNGKVFRLGNTTLTVLPPTILANALDWYQAKETPADALTEIEFVDKYTPPSNSVVTESWDASLNQDGSVKCYVEYTKLTISGNGTGKIMGASDSFSMGCGFINVTNIKGLELLDLSEVMYLDALFAGFNSLTSIDCSCLASATKNAMWSSLFMDCNSLTSLDVSMLPINSNSAEYYGGMFAGCSSLSTIKLFKLAPDKDKEYVDISSMFEGCSSLQKLDLSDWDVSNVAYMKNLFTGCSSLQELNLSNWDTRLASENEQIGDMFDNCPSLKRIKLGENFVLNDTNLLPGETWYDGAGTALTPEGLYSLDRSGFGNMPFYNTVIPKLKSSWEDNAPTGCDRHAIASISIVDSYVPTGSELNYWDADTTNTGAIKVYQLNDTELIIAGNGSGAISLAENANGTFFASCDSLTALTGLDVLDPSSIKGTYLAQMFADSNSLTSLDLSSWNTASAAENDIMNNMFFNCKSLTNVILGPDFKFNVSDSASFLSNNDDLSNNRWKDEEGNIYSAKELAWMDRKVTLTLSALTYPVIAEGWTLTSESGINIDGVVQVDIIKSYVPDGTETSSWNMDYFGEGKVKGYLLKDKGSVYSYKDKQTIEGDKIIIAGDGSDYIILPLNCECMFKDMRGDFTGLALLDARDINVLDRTFMNTGGNSSLKTLDLSNWIIIDCAVMTETFAGSGYEEIFLGKIVFNSPGSIQKLFVGSNAITKIDVSKLNTKGVFNGGYVFADCQNLTEIDLSSWDTSSFEDMATMFGGDSNLKTIYVSDKWSTANVTSSNDMFAECASLVGAVPYDSTKVDASMANYTTGYLTYKA